jgi:hypothetical protein
MTDWLAIRVELVSGAAQHFDPSLGRIYIVGLKHTFFDLYEAIEASFGRWEQGHLHAFVMDNDELIGPDPDGELRATDEEGVFVAERVTVGDRFMYIFDWGDEWRHECVVEELPADALPRPGDEEFLDRPAPIFGWGQLPDQYGRKREDSEEPEFD